MTGETTTSQAILFGIRRFRFAMVSFVGTDSAFVVWSRFVEALMFVFPFGHSLENCRRLRAFQRESSSS